MEKMANYNKFAVAASDLNGKWTNDFSGMTQYVNAYTGADAGANTHASNQNLNLAQAILTNGILLWPVVLWATLNFKV